MKQDVEETELPEEKKKKNYNSRETANLFSCLKDLEEAKAKFKIEKLEKAISKSQKFGFDQNELKSETFECQELLQRLKRLERLRKEVLDLKQSTIAELRSYNKPHETIHKVMIATYLLLGTNESKTQKWTSIQTLLGKTGKEGLKRRIGQIKITDIDNTIAKRASALLSDVDLEFIRDISAGAATFYVWVKGIIDEPICDV